MYEVALGRAGWVVADMVAVDGIYRIGDGGIVRMLAVWGGRVEG